MNHWYVDGKVYDFSEWGKIHPGGNFFALTPSFQRDISPAYHAYHKDPEKLRPILDKYEVKLEGKEAKDILCSDMNVPPFIVPPDFDARRDVPTYDWEKPFMKSLRKKINAPDMQKRIKRADFAFDVVGACLFVVHALVSFPALYFGTLPAWFWVFLQIVIRTSLAGVGHYHCHRPKNGRDDWGDSLFDMQYVGASVILADGHVMLHHMYTETPADVKRTVFNYMLTLPRLWRVPLFTAQKFAEAMTGHFCRFVVVSGGPENAIDQPPELRRKELQLKFIRSLLVVELIFAVCCGKLWLWCAQFFFTVWVNMFQIVASHDFEVVREKQDYRNLDWGVHQVTSALDTYVTGIQVVDIFLSAGLSCHRTHHTLPYQRSGFANIISTPALRETCKEFDVPWEPTRNLLLDRFFPLMWHYLTAPCQIPANPKPILVGGDDGLRGFFKEHVSAGGRTAAWNGITNIGNGFTGESI